MAISSSIRKYFAVHRNDLIVIATLVVVFSLLLEQTVRVYIYGAAAFSYREMDSIGSLRSAGILQASSDPGIVYELKPNLDSYFKLAEFKTNSHGLRDEEYSVEKPPDTFRVAVIGGSYTLPSGLGIDVAFHTVLENRLNRESRGTRYEFLNFGVGGYATKNKIATLRAKAFAYEPDLILFVLDGTKLADETGTKRRFVPKKREANFFQSFALQLFKKSRVVVHLFGDATRYLDKQEKSLEKLELELAELREISEASGVPICVVELDHDYSSHELAEEVGTRVLKSGLHFSNTVPAFEGTHFKDLSVDEIDPHPNAAAHRVFAEVLYADLQKQSLLGPASR